jgi:NADH-quinone oxidoreductase subunit L
MLAIPSVLIGWFTAGPALFGDYFGASIFVLPGQDVLGELAEEWHGPLGFVLHGLQGLPVYLALAGVGLAWFLYLRQPALPEQLRKRAGMLYALLVNKYFADTLAERLIPAGSRAVGQLLWRVGDVAIIDGAAVNGSARLVGWCAGVVRRVQTGYLYHYAFAMVIGLAVLVGWLIASQ